MLGDNSLTEFNIDNTTTLCSNAIIQIECTKLHDSTVHRHYVRVYQGEKISVKYFRDIIEKEIHIPIVCQVQLNVNGIPLDPLPPNFTDFPSRMFLPGKPILITLDYYTAGADLYTIHSAIEQFNRSISTDEYDYQLLSDSLDVLEVSCFNVSWDSDEAVGARLFIHSMGFLPNLCKVVRGLNSKLKSSFDELFTTDGKRTLADNILLCSHILAQALSDLMLLSARWEDKMIICKMNFPSVISDTFFIARLFLSVKYNRLQRIGESLIHYCIRELQLLLSVRSVSVEFGLNIKFVKTLKDSLILGRGLSRHHISDAICLFNLSGSSSVSRLLYSSGIYSEVIKHYLNQDITKISDSNLFELHFRISLVTLHMLKTPNLSVTSDEILQHSADLLRRFLSHITAENIADIERGCFCFGTLENYISVLYIPSNSIIGKLMSDEIYLVKYSALIQDFVSMGILTMEVLMMLEPGRRVILSENLLPHLVIADWTTGHMLSKVKLHFPSIPNLPVPSLYDIAAIKAVHIGIGDYKEMMHYKF
ncbi:hypothetical protein LOD99_14340 [Oopsacas minuta]|uniref:Uncharacterized protein n=1 Tax=Oopsacas minuta TaxID=111878 RepID=A0AAV7KFW3_9METZ|nr:hypothetical protein LOD99_14340 [Oopsacas minuta]